MSSAAVEIGALRVSILTTCLAVTAYCFIAYGIAVINIASGDILAWYG